MEHALQETGLRNVSSAHRNDATLAYVSSFTTLKRQREGVEGWPARFAMELHPYFAVKQMIEDRILDAARWGLRAVVVNPTLCLGPWDMRARRLTLIPLLLCGEVAGSVAHNLNVLDVREVAAGLVAAVELRRYATPMIFSGHNISAQARSLRGAPEAASTGAGLQGRRYPGRPGQRSRQRRLRD